MRAVYPLAALLYGLLCFLYFSQEMYRLPVYYLPDGVVVRDLNTPFEPGDRIHRIDSQKVIHAPKPGYSTEHTLESNRGQERYSTIAFGFSRFFSDFKFTVFLALIFLLTGIWFLNYARDVHLALFSFAMTICITLTMALLVYAEGYILWQIFIFAMAPLSLNLALRTTGKEIGSRLMIAELLFLLFFSLLTYVGSNAQESVNNLILLSGYIIYLSAIILLIIQIDAAFRVQGDRIAKMKGWNLVTGSFFGLLVPLHILAMFQVPFDPFAVPSLLAIVFPASLLYGTYRIHLVPFQFVITKSLLAGVLSVLFIAIYGIFLLIYSIVLPQTEFQNYWIVSIFALIVITFFIDPARRKLAGFLDRKLLQPSGELAESLKRIATLVSYPLKAQTSTSAFLKEVQRTLKVEKVYLLLSSNTFPELRIRSDGILRMPDSDGAWKHLTPQRIVVTSYLTYGSGVRASLYNFLMSNRISVAVGIGEPGQIPGIFPGTGKDKTDRIRAALLIGRPQGRTTLLLSEIRYIQEVARIAGMTIENLYLMLQEVEKRRKVREVHQAGHFQKLMRSAMHQIPDEFKTAYFNKPVISVTGDYLDHISIGQGISAFFVGDVSGHGLGTGYIVSAIRAIVRSQLEAGRSLSDTFNALNAFLLERYDGNEFITLFGMILNKDNATMEYLNAAHPACYIRDPDSGRIKRLEETQRLLGILPAVYEAKERTMKPGERIFVVSDGVIETFDPEDQVFSEQRLESLLADSGDLPLEEIASHLEKALETHRQSRHASDDTTFLAVEYSPRWNPFQAFLSLFRKDDSDE